MKGAGELLAEADLIVRRLVAIRPGLSKHVARWQYEYAKWLEWASSPAVNIKMEDQVDFGEALKIVKAGGKVARAGWNGEGMHVALQVPDEHSKMGHPYLYLSPVDGGLVPWAPSQTDLLAGDWEEII